MPITIQNNKLQIRNAEGNYVNIDAVSDATVAERLTEINAAGQAQISAIGRKGTETLASIPSDYTELSGEVDDLNSAIGEKIDQQQGSGNAGKALVVGSDGLVTTGEAGIPDAVKSALLNLVQHVAYTDEHGSTYFEVLRVALYGGSDGYPKIMATYDQGEHVIYANHSLESLRQRMTVIYYADKSSAGEQVSGYTLSGTLKEGQTSNIIVSYNGMIDVVDVSVAPYINGNLTFYIGFRESLNDDHITYDATSNNRAVINPMGFYVPAGESFVLDMGGLAGGNYYIAPVGVIYDTEIYDVDWNIVSGVSKNIINNNDVPLRINWGIGAKGWSNQNQTFTYTENMFVAINVKKGSAGTSVFTASDIAQLNANVKIRRAE